MFDLNNLVRENIKTLKAYSSARDEYKGKEGLFLDANENSFGAPVYTKENLNRYPDPLQLEVKRKLSELKGVPPSSIFLGNGSDEAIDILFRTFCKPGIDNGIVCPPTYGMYEVSAAINDVAVINIPLIEETFQLDLEKVKASISDKTKLIFICSPNNPTGNVIKRNSIKALLNVFKGIVVLDEAYIDFAKEASFVSDLKKHSNLVILQTLSKAWGLAGLRVGMAFASREIIEIFNKIKAPYNINSASQLLVLEALKNEQQVKKWIIEILEERNVLEKELLKLYFVKRVYVSEANFLLVKTDNAKLVYDFLITHGVVVRNRSMIKLCEDCIRITIGTKEENKQVINALKQFNQ